MSDIEPDYKLLRKLRKRLKAAETDLYVAVKNNLKPGTVIEYEMSGHPQTGTIQEIVGTPWSIGIRVTNNRTKKTYDISLYNIPLVLNYANGNRQ